VLGAIARVTAPTFVEIARGGVKRGTVDDRLRWFGRRVVELLDVDLTVIGRDRVPADFVSLDPNGKPRKIPTLIPETEEEKKLFEGALRRRQVRLILGGKMQPNDATELKALFTNK
jgi:hypothetical protein